MFWIDSADQLNPKTFPLQSGNDNIVSANGKAIKLNVIKLYTVYYGLCHVLSSNFFNFKPNTEIRIIVKTIGNSSELYEISTFVTSDLDFVGLLHNAWIDVTPWSFKAKFGNSKYLATIQEDEMERVICKDKDPQYVSMQQCFASVTEKFAKGCHKQCLPLYFEGTYF